MKIKAAMALVLGAAATGCMTDGATGAGAQEAGPTASASITDRERRMPATANLTQVRNMIRVQINVAGMAPGTYGVHIHATGMCTPPSFASAGPHWNPTGRQHGASNPQGKHLGDLPNLQVDAQGRANFVFALENASIDGGTSPLLDADGAAIVIHAQPDDYRTDPSGNSGDRIACGVVQRGAGR